MTRPRTAVLMVDAGRHRQISLAVARSLSEVPEVRLHVLSHTARVRVRWSRHIRSFHVEPTVDDNEWIEAVERLAEEHAIDVLLAVSEPGIRFLARHQLRLQGVATVAPGPSLASFDLAVNKARYSKFLEEQGFWVPATVDVRPSEIADGTIGDRLGTLQGPLLLKPTRMGGGAGIQRFESSAQLATHLAGLQEMGKEEFFAQEIVSGQDICCTVLCDNGRLVAHATYHGLATVKPFQPWHCAEFVVDDEAVEKTAEIVALLNWSGPANLDFIRSTTGELCSLEFNGRYDGHVLGAVRTGVNFPGLHLQLAQGVRVEQPDYTPGVLVDHRGLVEQTWARLRGRPHLDFGYRQTLLPQSFRDPLPEIMTAVGLVQSRLTRSANP